MKKFYHLLTLLSVVLTGATFNASAQSTVTYNYTGAVQTYTVPTGIFSITANVQGARGGLNSDGVLANDRPGYGGCAQATFTVTPGQVLNVYVGGHGTNATVGVSAAGGFNGGGAGYFGPGPNLYSGGGGGGASDIRIGGVALSDRKIVGGGGGGAARYCGNLDKDRGGDGGGASAATGTTTGETGIALCVAGTTTGGGGGSGAGGAGGTCTGCTGNPGTAGVSGVGGNAGNCCVLGAGSGGGGGGGGYFGGGGGQWTGGGGGSSYVAPGATSVTQTRGCNTTGDGIITITPICSIPAITGTTHACVGLTSTLSDSYTGGTWSSSDETIATIDSITGLVTSIMAGTVTITYTLGPCTQTTTFTADPLPATISGTLSVCQGLTTTLTDSTGGGTWISGVTGVATIGSLTGVVTGVSAGIAPITYRLTATGCITVSTFTVNPLPAAIAGTTNVCFGLTTTLTDATGTGTWSSSDTTIAPIDSMTGVVTGRAVGTVHITYTLPATGCIATTTFVVNPLPSLITGVDTICVGATTALFDSTTGGHWTSGATGIATIGSSTGIVTGISAGIAPITYTLPTGCISTYSVLINPLPTLYTMTGGGAYCASDSGVHVGLSNSDTGKVYQLFVSGVPIGGLTSGTGSALDFGLQTSAGGYTVLATDDNTGCQALMTGTVTVIVNPLPAAIGGPTEVCQGSTITLTDATSGGAWTSSDVTVATIGSTGIVTGEFGGSVTITYTLPTSCFVTTSVTVNPIGPITGTTVLCVGYTSSLDDSVGGGTWISGNPSVATVDLVSGIVTGVSFGTAVITYTLPTGCFATITVSVNPLSAITGTPFVCEGLTTALSDATPGGTWSSSDETVATIGSTTGVVTGISGLDVVTITYTLGTGCTSTMDVTVYPLPTAISGPTSVCIGQTITLTNGASGGTWISSVPSVATVGSTSGMVLGVSIGTTVITYELPTGCLTTTTITVNDLSPITGPTTLCDSSTITLSNASAGGLWSSDDESVALIGSTTGVVTAISSGMVLMTYTLPSGCFTTTTLTVNPLPGMISGPSEVCQGQTITLTNTGTGTWSSTDPSIASVVAGTGVVTGIAPGTDSIIYTLTGTGCMRATTITVNPIAPITGPTRVCVGSSITLVDTVTGGTWSTGSSFITLGSTTGDVTGASAGTAVVTYTLPTGCFATYTVVVNPLPAAISGASTVCVGVTTTLTDASGPGTWSSSDATIASVGSTTGIVTGVAAGTADITFTVTSTGCIATFTMTVYTLSPITGGDSVCVGSSITLSDTAGGGLGTWSASSGIVTIGSTTGVVTGVAPGVTTIFYTLPTGCQATLSFTVNPLPFAIAPHGDVCEGLSITLVDVTGTGTWSSSDPTLASIGSTTGIVTGGATGGTVGVVTITYTLSTGCYVTSALTVNPAPAAIVGTFELCQGTSTTLTDATSGGTWISTTGGVATIGSTTGLLTGVGGGTSIITYQLTTTGCIATQVVTVDPVDPIVGTNHVCVGSTTTLTNVRFGTWSSSDDLIASIGSTTGVVTGVAPGTVTITYTTTTGGCISTMAFTVNPLPAAISPATSTICQGQTVTLTDGTSGGTWISSDITVATVGSLSGVVRGTGGGTAIISYIITATGCYQTATVDVTPVTPITGPNNVCYGSTITLTNASGGGTWSSGSPGVATIGSASGLVTPVAVGGGTTVITYLLPSGCSATITVTVNPLPANITGPTEVCTNGSILLSDTSPFGTWSSSATGTATVGSLTGVVSGVAGPGGTVTITYTLPTTCYTTYAVTVNPAPGVITGPSSVCVGFTINLTDGTGGGTWSSSNGTIASVGSSTGVVTGNSSGVATITYRLTSTGCFVTKAVTVNVLPTGITGPTTVCVGATITLSNSTGGGTWQSASGAIATVGSTTGIVTGVSSGTTTISYILGSGCYSLYSVTVLATPTATIIPLEDTMLCPGGDYVELTATTGASLAYQWYIGGSPIPGATSATYTATSSTPGNYQVRVTNTITGCGVLSRPMAVTLNPATATITIPGGSTTGCAGTGITLDANTGVGLSYQWQLDGVPISGATGASYLATATGDYTVIVTNTTGCSATSSAVTLTLDPSPSATVTLSGPLTFCFGDSVIMTAASGSGYTYQWNSTSTGPIPGATSMTFVANTADNYWVVVTNTIGCSSTSLSMAVVVNPLPGATIAASGPTTFCSGDNVVLSASPTGAGYTYQWYNGSTLVTGATGTLFVAATTGGYKVKITAPSGCSSLSAPTDVTMLTTPAIIPLTATAYCWGGSATLSVGIVGSATGATFQWYRNTILIPGAVGRTYTATTPGTYTAVVTAPGGCFVTSTSADVTQNPLPNPLVTFDGMVFHTQGYFITYQWYRNAVAIPGANSSSTPSIGDGEYKVGVTDTNGCQSISDVYVLTGWSATHGTSVTNVNGMNDVKIYPNPAKAVLHVEAAMPVRAILSSVDGRTVIDQKDAKDLDISQLADGIYLIKVFDANGDVLKTEKVVKASN